MLCCCIGSSKMFGIALAAAAGAAIGIAGTRALDAQPATNAPDTAPAIEHAGFQPELEMTPEQMMAMMKEWAAPVEAHEHLTGMAGTWDCTTKFWMGPGDPIVGTGTTQSEAVLGGRFITQHFTMEDFMGMPFEGMGAVGYDKGKGKYVNVWMDNFGTGFMTMEGEFDEKSQTMTWTGNAAYPGPDGVMEVPVKHIIKHKDADTMIMEFWEPNPETGEMMRTGEITYKRRA